MELVVWDDKFNIRIESIDMQHKGLFALINKLFVAMKADKEDEIMELLFNELENYTKTHFKTEEDYFQQFNYENKEAHINEHNAFIRKISEFRKSYEEKEQDASADILIFLSNWLYNHILISDNRYAGFLLSKGVK